MPLIDTGQVEDFDPIPVGTYECVVSDAEYIEESESSGEPFVKFEFTVDEGEYANRKLFRNHSCQPQALWALKRTLIALGIDKDKLAGSWDTDEILPEIQGSPCRLSVGIRDYEGTETNEVKRVLPAAARV